jgi:hypothetical protein
MNNPNQPAPTMYLFPQPNQLGTIVVADLTWRCSKCNAEVHKLYGALPTGPFYCWTCFGFRAAQYVGGESWLERLWREWMAIAWRKP